MINWLFQSSLMSKHLNVTMLPAKEGDCLLVSYGETDALKYILIDAGRAWTYKNALKKTLEDKAIDTLELLVVTHVDRDHIDGILSLVKDDSLQLTVKNIWFNGWEHLDNSGIEQADLSDLSDLDDLSDLGGLNDEQDLEEFGAKMGEEFSPFIIQKKWPWNKQFKGYAVEVRDDAAENEIQIGEIKLTLLSPNRQKLDELKPVWKKECEKAGITPGASLDEYVVEDDDIEVFGAPNIERLAVEAFKDDHSKANGSSIAFILEYQGKKLLLSGDAHVDLLLSGLKKLGATKQQPYFLDLFKVPHHGSKYNISKELLEVISCQNFLVSTNGNYFKHPEDVAMARLIKFGTDDATIHFNYKTDFNKYWENQSWQNRYHYQVEFPEETENGFKTITLIEED